MFIIGKSLPGMSAVGLYPLGMFIIGKFLPGMSAVSYSVIPTRDDRTRQIPSVCVTGEFSYAFSSIDSELHGIWASGKSVMKINL